MAVNEADKRVRQSGLKAAYDALRGMMTAAETTLTASAPHPIGSYFEYGGALYQATDDIASGASIVLSGSGQNAELVPGGLSGEVSDLKSAFVYLGYTEGPGVNLLDPNSLLADKLLNESTGEPNDREGYKTSGFIAVKPNTKYTMFAYNPGVTVPTVTRVIEYTADKTFLSSLGKIEYSTTLSYKTTSSTAAWIRISILDAVAALTSMFSEVIDDQMPETIEPYAIQHYLADYLQKSEFAETEAQIDDIQDIIDDNFTPNYAELTGTITYSKYINQSGAVDDIAIETYCVLAITVTPHASYKISANVYQKNYYYAFYDSNDNFISGLKAPTNSGTTSITDSEALAPANAVKLVAASGNVPPVIKGIDGYVDLAARPWLGKKWAVVGDSLTQVNAATTKHYFDYISEQSGIATHNMGVGGSGYMRRANENKAFYQRIPDVPTDSDVVTIFGSGNDLNIAQGAVWADVLGTYTDSTTDTICGCVNATLDAYFAVMPTAPIGIIAPTPWMGYPTTLTTGNRMAEYTAALKQIAEYRGVPFLDLYHHSNLRPENEANRDACFYDGASLDGNGDGVHPNELGHKIIAPKIYEFVKQLLLA